MIKHRITAQSCTSLAGLETYRYGRSRPYAWPAPLTQDQRFMMQWRCISLYRRALATVAGQAVEVPGIAAKRSALSPNGRWAFDMKNFMEPGECMVIYDLWNGCKVAELSFPVKVCYDSISINDLGQIAALDEVEGMQVVYLRDVHKQPVGVGRFMFPSTVCSRSLQLSNTGCLTARSASGQKLYVRDMNGQILGSGLVQFSESVEPESVRSDSEGRIALVCGTHGKQIMIRNIFDPTFEQRIEMQQELNADSLCFVADGVLSVVDKKDPENNYLIDATTALPELVTLTLAMPLNWPRSVNQHGLIAGVGKDERTIFIYDDLGRPAGAGQFSFPKPLMSYSICLNDAGMLAIASFGKTTVYFRHVSGDTRCSAEIPVVYMVNAISWDEQRACFILHLPNNVFYYDPHKACMVSSAAGHYEQAVSYGEPALALETMPRQLAGPITNVSNPLVVAWRWLWGSKG